VVVVAESGEVTDRDMRCYIDDDVDESSALTGHENGEPPDQPRTGAAVERLVIGQSSDDSRQVVCLWRVHVVSCVLFYWAHSRQIIFFSLASWLR
jgi:hypothetical protein